MRQRPWRQVNLSQEAEYMRKFDYNFRKQNNILVPETLELAGFVLGAVVGVTRSCLGGLFGCQKTRTNYVTSRGAAVYR